MQLLHDESLRNKYIRDYELHSTFSQELIASSQLHMFDKDEWIMLASDSLSYYYFILNGQVKISYPFENGKSLLLKFYGPMQTLGDMELLRNEPIRCDIQATRNTLLLGFPVSHLRSTYLMDPLFLQHLVKSLGDKLYATLNNEAYNLTYPLVNRLASYLMEVSQGESSLLLKDTYENIAAFLGTTYRHLRRIFIQLEEQGILLSKGKSVTILDAKKLSSLAKGTFKLQTKK